MFTFVTVRDRKVNTSDTVNRDAVTTDLLPCDYRQHGQGHFTKRTIVNLCVLFFYYKGMGRRVQNTVTVKVSRGQFPSPETGRKTEIENKVIFRTVCLGFLDMNFY